MKIKENTVQDQAPAMPVEQAAELRALSLSAADDDSIPMAPAGPDQAEMWAALPAMVGSMLRIALPDLEKVYTPEACRAWGSAMVPVAEKYGWDVEGVLSVELVAVAASAPLVLGTVQVIRAAKEKAALVDMRKRADAQAHFAMTRGLGDGAPGEPVPASAKAVQFGASAVPEEVAA